VQVTVEVLEAMPLIRRSPSEAGGFASIKRVDETPTSRVAAAQMSSNDAFSTLIWPLTKADFFSDAWTKRAVHVRRPSRTFSRYFSWDALSFILTSGDLQVPKLNLFQGSRSVTPSAFSAVSEGQQLIVLSEIMRLFENGAMIIIQDADSHWAPLRSLANSFYDVLFETPRMTVHCSPATGADVAIHYDTPEVFALQIDGMKRWQVFEPTMEAPLPDLGTKIPPPAAAKPYLDVVLNEGDLLYVPRGHWHRTFSMDTPSLHVAAKVLCRSGATLLSWFARKLLADPLWRRNAPLLSSALSHGELTLTPELKQWTTELRQSLLERVASLSAVEICDEFCRDTLLAIHPGVKSDALFHADRLGPLDLTVFERPAARWYIITEVADGIVDVTVAGGTLRISGLTSRLINQILSEDAFTVSELRTWESTIDIEGVSTLLVNLVHAGLLVARPLTAAPDIGATEAHTSVVASQ
jgi:ribosomal protein L16 Arg81 hydroxylase